MKKYELTSETKVADEKTLHRIKALVSFGNVAAGELGGWIEKEENLSQFGDAWVCGDAWVYGDALVYGNAQVCGEARVYRNAQIYGNAQVCGDAWVCGDARVYGDARVHGDAWVFDNALVYGNARVYGDAWVFDNALVSGNAWVYGDARVHGDAWVYGDARVYGNAQVCGVGAIFWIGGIGSRNGTTTFFACKDKKIRVVCGCFFGTLDEFERAVRETHGENEHAKVYMLAIEMAKARIDLTKVEADA